MSIEPRGAMNWPESGWRLLSHEHAAEVAGRVVITSPKMEDAS